MITFLIILVKPFEMYDLSLIFYILIIGCVGGRIQKGLEWIEDSIHPLFLCVLCTLVVK